MTMYDSAYHHSCTMDLTFVAPYMMMNNIYKCVVTQTSMMSHAYTHNYMHSMGAYTHIALEVHVHHPVCNIILIYVHPALFPEPLVL
jgi:hypothetical protein